MKCTCTSTIPGSPSRSRNRRTSPSSDGYAPDGTGRPSGNGSRPVTSGLLQVESCDGRRRARYGLPPYRRASTRRHDGHPAGRDRRRPLGTDADDPHRRGLRDSLRGRDTKLYLRGERLDEPADHPLLQGSINAMRATYEIANERPDEFMVESPYTGERVNRFLHVTTSPEDLRAKHQMQRELGQRTGTCFQRCVGMDAVPTMESVTYDLDAANGTDYHDRYVTFLTELQRRNLVLAGGMTDVKGDRGKRPPDQADADLYVHVTRRTAEGLYLRGAKAHMTGGWNSHWIMIMPTMATGPRRD